MNDGPRPPDLDVFLRQARELGFALMLPVDMPLSTNVSFPQDEGVPLWAVEHRPVHKNRGEIMSNSSLHWNDLNKREQFILQYISNHGQFWTEDYEVLNKAWKRKLGVVTQARISQVVTDLIDKEWLFIDGRRGSGRSRLLKISNDAKGEIQIGDVGIIKRSKNSYNRWTKSDDEILAKSISNGTPLSEVARKLKRSENGVLSRIRKIRSNS